LVKNIKKQHRIGDSAQLTEKVLKILKMNLDKERDSSKKLNTSGFSQDSKFSR
jgi:hypothetical protein